MLIRLANHSSMPWEGWKRTTIDSEPPYPAGVFSDGSVYVTGRRIGLDARVVDVWCRLAPGQRLDVNLKNASAYDFALQPLPDDPVGYFGGLLTIGGLPLEWVGLEPDGAAWTVHLRRRVGRMICVDVWLQWYPDQPAIAPGEVMIIASNPAVPDMGEAAPQGMHLQFGDALIGVPGLRLGAPLLAPGTYLADGQGKAFPFVAIWTRHLQGAQWVSVPAALQLGVCAVGCTRTLHDAAPMFPPGFSVRSWAALRWPEAVRRLHTWDPPICGPNPRAPDPGAQEDQLLHAGGEALLPDGVGAEVVRYLSALKLFAERPCNHLEADGRPLELDLHPGLLCWDGRPHFNGSDTLGKPRGLTAEEAHGRMGPDVQHHYQRTLAAAARLTGSHVCQFLLARLAVVYLTQRTAGPVGSGQAATFSAREWGCEAFAVLDFDRDLEDRALAARCVQRWRDRVDRVLLPRMATESLLFIYQNPFDPRVNPTGPGVQWWQESFAAMGIDEACRIFAMPAGRAVALRIARRVLDVAWRLLPDGRWRSQPQGPIDGSANDQNPEGDGFNAYGMPGCVAVVLRHEPENGLARMIWQQLLQATSEDARRWMLPGIEARVDGTTDPLLIQPRGEYTRDDLRPGGV